MCTSLQYPPHYLPDHRLLCVLWGKQKAPGMNLHNHLASIDWRFNYFSKFNPGAEALRIDISVLTHYHLVTNQIFSFAFPVRYDLSGKPSLSRAIGSSQDTDRTLTWSMLSHPLFTTNISAPPSTPRIPFRQFHFTMFLQQISIVLSHYVEIFLTLASLDVALITLIKLNSVRSSQAFPSCFA